MPTGCATSMTSTMQLALRRASILAQLWQYYILKRCGVTPRLKVQLRLCFQLVVGPLSVSTTLSVTCILLYVRAAARMPKLTCTGFTLARAMLILMTIWFLALRTWYLKLGSMPWSTLHIISGVSFLPPSLPSPPMPRHPCLCTGMREPRHPVAAGPPARILAMAAEAHMASTQL